METDTTSLRIPERKLMALPLNGLLKAFISFQKGFLSDTRLVKKRPLKGFCKIKTWGVFTVRGAILGSFSFAKVPKCLRVSRWKLVSGCDIWDSLKKA